MRARFILSQTFKGIRSNFSMFLSIVLVTFVSLLLVGAAVLLQNQIGNMKNDWYDKVEVSVFMCPQDSTEVQCAAGEATQEQIDAVADFLENSEISELVDEVYFETKEDALTSFQKQMEGKDWVQSLTAEEMQVSFRVKLVDPQQYQVVAEALSGLDGVETVEDQREQLEGLFSVLNRLTLIAGILAGVMIIAALLLIPSTIRLSAMFRRNETEIMRFVGASNTFIQLPFILEGVLAAALGSILAIAGLYVAVDVFIADWFQGSWINVVNYQDVLALAPWLLLGAVVVASLASFIALRRYTKV